MSFRLIDGNLIDDLQAYNTIKPQKKTSAAVCSESHIASLLRFHHTLDHPSYLYILFSSPDVAITWLLLRANAVCSSVFCDAVGVNGGD